MKPDITIAEAKDAAQELRSAISNAVLLFFDKTGMVPSVDVNVRCARHQVIDGQYRELLLTGVDVTVDADLFG